MYVDRTASNTSSNYLINTGLTSPTNASTELIFGAIGVAAGTYDIDFAPDVGFTEIQEANSLVGNAGNRSVTGAFKVVNSQGSYNVTGSLAEPTGVPIDTSVTREVYVTGTGLPPLGAASVTATRFNNTRITVTGTMPSSTGVDYYWLKGSTTAMPSTDPFVGTILAQGIIGSGQAIPSYNWTGLTAGTTGYVRLIVRSTNSGIEQTNATATSQATT